MTVVMNLNYDNSNDYYSPVGAQDNTDWLDTQGRKVTSTSVTDEGYGTVSVAFPTTTHAGEYTLDCFVNGVEVSNSP